ncbi:MAG: pur operon repressor [Clostridiales bacterium]|nr:pur operon repressor [Clostridiales bacterium]
MKKNIRIGMLIDDLLANPCKKFEASFFCNKYNIAKSSLSEDMRLINEVFNNNGSGRIISVPGVGGGIKYVPGISESSIISLQEKLCEMLSDPSRLLGGGFLYTSDIMFDGQFIQSMARVWAQCFYDKGASCVVTVETKGIPLAERTAEMLNLPLVVIRREAMYSEGSTVSINYFSGSSDRIQKMSISKRAVEPGTKAIIIDDFMRGGGSVKGIVEILAEFDVEVVGVGIAFETKEPIKKKAKDYTSIVRIDEINEDEKRIKLSRNDKLLEQISGIEYN